MLPLRLLDFDAAAALRYAYAFFAIRLFSLLMPFTRLLLLLLMAMPRYAV